MPYVNPAVQLLWKVADIRARDEQDFAAVVPSLPAHERRWLADAIELGAPTSPWATRARAAVDGYEVLPGADGSVIITVQATEVLGAGQKSSIVDLCIAAHEMDEFRHLFMLIPSGRHFLVTRGSELVSHGVVSTRWGPTRRSASPEDRVRRCGLDAPERSGARLWERDDAPARGRDR